MSQLLQFFILVPLLGFLVSIFIPGKKETLLSGVSIITVCIHFLGVFIFCVYWLMNAHPTLDIKHLVLYKTSDFEFFIDFYFDKITAAYAVVGSFLTLMVNIFSRYYMHRDEGFKRFFNILLLFYSGYNLVIFSGNFETLFLGWEILGLSSFLLITFYRDRYLPVKNGLKVISIYRFSDICIMLAMWMSHYLWHENVTFVKLSNSALVNLHLQDHSSAGIFIALMLVLAAAAKSAQMPFSAWLPRAMEGPTTSSAIFYGSLSVHLGAFILLRTFPFWESITIIKVIILFISISTAIIATGIARVQSSVKIQIAYSSIAQMGIIFVEIALGFHNLALIHFAGNAFLRTYQLLVSPSLLNYLIHNQFYNFKPANNGGKEPAFKKLRYTLYFLFLKEFNLESFLKRILWNPFKWVGNKVKFITGKVPVAALILLLPAGTCIALFKQNVPQNITEYLPSFLSFLSLLLILNAFTERQDPLKAWKVLFLSQLFTALSIFLNEVVEPGQMLLYVSGTLISFVAGYISLHKMKKTDPEIDLNRFHGHVYENPKLAFVFLLSCLGLVCFPVTTAFIGIDLLFMHVKTNQGMLITFMSLCYVFIELSAFRIYTRVFLGQHKKNYHPIAYRSS